MIQQRKWPRSENAQHAKTLGEIIAPYQSHPKRYCRNHPLSAWTPGYPHCREGFRKGEQCIEGE